MNESSKPLIPAAQMVSIVELVTKVTDLLESDIYDIALDCAEAANPGLTIQSDHDSEILEDIAWDQYILPITDIILTRVKNHFPL